MPGLRDAGPVGHRAQVPNGAVERYSMPDLWAGTLPAMRRTKEFTVPTRHVPRWDGTVWDCPLCEFTTEDDAEAEKHYLMVEFPS